jgi:hypothetical protein
LYTRTPSNIEILNIVTIKNTLADWIALSDTTMTNIA